MSPFTHTPHHMMDPNMQQQPQLMYYYAPGAPPQQRAAPHPAMGPNMQQQPQYPFAPGAFAGVAADSNDFVLPPGALRAPPMFYQPPEPRMPPMQRQMQQMDQQMHRLQQQVNELQRGQPPIPLPVVYSQMPQLHPMQGFEGPPLMIPMMYQDPGQVMQHIQPMQQQHPQQMPQHMMNRMMSTGRTRRMQQRQKREQELEDLMNRMTTTDHMQQQQQELADFKNRFMSTEQLLQEKRTEESMEELVLRNQLEDLEFRGDISPQSSIDTFRVPGHVRWPAYGPWYRAQRRPPVSSARPRVSLPTSNQNGDSSSANYKTRMCVTWMTSRDCPMGDSCFYAHDIAELRVLERPNRVASPIRSSPESSFDYLRVFPGSDYKEPADERSPADTWYVFELRAGGADSTGTTTGVQTTSTTGRRLSLRTTRARSAYLIGRNPLLAHLHLDHCSCSKHHAVLQYRLESRKGPPFRPRLPYIFDLGSANGTFVNGERVEASKYIELKENDVLKFGDSPDYVLLTEKTLENEAKTTPLDETELPTDSKPATECAHS